jgi:hypothetical protein
MKLLNYTHYIMDMPLLNVEANRSMLVDVKSGTSIATGITTLLLSSIESDVQIVVATGVNSLYSLLNQVIVSRGN